MSDSFEDAVPANGNGSSELEAAREYVRNQIPDDSTPDLKHSRRRKEQAPISFNQLPPHSNEAEQGVLGCCLLSPKDCLPEVIKKTNGNVEVCYDLRHQTILAALFAMYDNAYGIDIITLQQRLKDFDLLDQVGGISYLNALADVSPSGANLPYYLDIMVEKYLLRKAIQTCTDCVGRCYDAESEVTQTLDEVERAVLNIRREFVTSESSGMKELIPQAINDIEAAFNRDGSLTGLATGFADFDRMTNGLQLGEMIVLAARPSLGKTSLMCNIAENVAINLGLPVGIFSLEMTKAALTTRILTGRARVNLRNIRDGFMAEADFPKLTMSAGILVNSLIRIDDTPGLSIMALRARARAMWQQYGIKLFGIDYLQLLHSTTKRARENRQQEVSEISSGIKALAKELNVPVIILSQLNRDIEKDKKRKPRLSDLRESGAIEQDADLVGFLYKPARGDDEEPDYGVEEPDGVMVNLDIAKQRNGPVGTVALTFLKPYTRFESAARVSDNDVPNDGGQQQFPDP